MPDSPERNAGLRRRIIVSALLLALLAVLPYLGGARHAFVYDDHGQIVDNPFLSSADRWSKVLQLRTLNDGAIINGRRPVVVLTYLTDRALWDLNPSGWRVTNYTAHGAAVVLLYLFLVRLVRRVDPNEPRNLFAFLAALLYAWHPAMVEAVQVPAFRADLLLLVFAMIAFHGALSLGGAETFRRQAACVLWVLAATWAALLSKESGAAVPLMIALGWICFPAVRPSRGAMVAVLAGGLALVGLLAYMSGRPGPDGVAPPPLQALGAEWNGRSLLFPDNLRTLPWLWWEYLRVMLVPIPLIVDRVIEPVRSSTSWRFIWGVCVLCATAAVWVWLWRKRYDWLAFGLGLMAVGFVPVSNIIPLMNPMAERYMPLMLTGFAILLAWGLAGRGLRTGPWRITRTIILAVLLVVYVVVGTLRVQDFRDDETLWTRTLQTEPRSARAHTWVGLILQRQDRLTEAAEYFGKAHVLNPYDLTPLINSAILYGRLGDLRTAEEKLREAVSIRPSFAPAHWNLAMALQFQGRMTDALEVINETLRLDPYHVEARKARIALLVKAQRYDEALADVQHLRVLSPDDSEARAAESYITDRIRMRDLQNRP